MKTREKKNGLPIVQAPVRGNSDESLTTPLSSTECSRKRRKDIYIYSNKCLHMELKKKYSLKKKLKAVKMP